MCLVSFFITTSPSMYSIIKCNNSSTHPHFCHQICLSPSSRNFSSRLIQVFVFIFPLLISLNYLCLWRSLQHLDLSQVCDGNNLHLSSTKSSCLSSMNPTQQLWYCKELWNEHTCSWILWHLHGSSVLAVTSLQLKNYDVQSLSKSLSSWLHPTKPIFHFSLYYICAL